MLFFYTALVEIDVIMLTPYLSLNRLVQNEIGIKLNKLLKIHSKNNRIKNKTLGCYTFKFLTATVCTCTAVPPAEIPQFPCTLLTSLAHTANTLLGLSNKY